ncbi:MAG: UDP-glucose 4-epimerase GalE [SAR202 cluster bacterium]|jgi:UDP-glucose 4-epimerase|nr:UDP-glucose 4-epimerase GalE [SAR202 cluster bacterium]
MKILVTGGAGYIGSTVCSALEDHGHFPIVLDSFVTGRREFALERTCYEGDIGDRAVVARIFEQHPDIDCVIHCAALIVVPHSVAQPYEYYLNNVVKSLELFRNLDAVGCRRIVFSSSAAVYDTVPDFMVREESPLAAYSPYARSKVMVESILEDMCAATGLQGISLRYFNPIGADPDMRSGAHASDVSHALGKLVEVASEREPVFRITGTDWPTRDGTGVRDYIHVWDLALAHVKAVEMFDDVMSADSESSHAVINLGTGRGVTVKELVAAFESVIGHTIPKEEAPSRPGDVAGAFANADVALKLLGWKAEKTTEEAIFDAMKWNEVRYRTLGY